MKHLEDGVVFYVADNGIGIAPQYQERIFGLFKRCSGETNCRSAWGRIWLESMHGRVQHFILRYGDEHVAVEAIKAGALDYIVKSNMSLSGMPRTAERALREWDHILERKRVEKELRQYREHLEELVAQRTEELVRSKEVAEKARIASETANQAKSRFLSNMSHELRTPLNVILGFAQLMQRDPMRTPVQQKYLDTIMRSGEHLLKLINDVLDMSKIETGHITLRSQPFDVWQTLKHIEEMIRSRAVHKGLQFVVIRAPEVPRYITTDEGKLQQILINLLSNAVKFTDHGEIQLSVNSKQCSVNRDQLSVNSKQYSVNSSQYSVNGKQLKEQADPLITDHSSLITDHGSLITDHGLLFTVKDTGIGIAPDELEHIFDPFVQSSVSRGVPEGSGLGLAISRQFVQLLGGALTVTSQPGQGAVFTFTIQAEVTDAAQVEDRYPQGRVVGLAPHQHAPDGRPYRILIAEDNEFNRLLLQHMLESLRPASGSAQILEVRTVEQGQEALEVVRQWRPHLVFMDMRMRSRPWPMNSIMTRSYNAFVIPNLLTIFRKIHEISSAGTTVFLLDLFPEIIGIGSSAHIYTCHAFMA